MNIKYKMIKKMEVEDIFKIDDYKCMLIKDNEESNDISYTALIPIAVYISKEKKYKYNILGVQLMNAFHVYDVKADIDGFPQPLKYSFDKESYINYWLTEYKDIEPTTELDEDMGDAMLDSLKINNGGHTDIKWFKKDRKLFVVDEDIYKAVNDRRETYAELDDDESSRDLLNRNYISSNFSFKDTKKHIMLFTMSGIYEISTNDEGVVFKIYDEIISGNTSFFDIDEYKDSIWKELLNRLDTPVTHVEYDLEKSFTKMYEAIFGSKPIDLIKDDINLYYDRMSTNVTLI